MLDRVFVRVRGGNDTTVDVLVEEVLPVRGFLSRVGVNKDPPKRIFSRASLLLGEDRLGDAFAGDAFAGDANGVLEFSCNTASSINSSKCSFHRTLRVLTMDTSSSSSSSSSSATIVGESLCFVSSPSWMEPYREYFLRLDDLEFAFDSFERFDRL